MRSIYLDHAATTPLDPQVNKVMYEHAEKIYGNPSSVHGFGREARKHIDEARKILARSIQARDTEIVFTSSGTEAINYALQGIAQSQANKGKHVITSNQKHQATLHTMEYLESIGYDVSYVQTDETGRMNPKDVEKYITDETILVSIMMVNNETGVIQPIQEIGSICADENIYFHTDAVQAFGPLDIDVDTLKVDLLTISAHKVNGPKGVGALFIKEGTTIDSILFGGDQERKRRAGTENVIGIVGFGQAVKQLEKNREEAQHHYATCKETFLTALRKENVSFHINGDAAEQIDGTVNVSFPGTQTESMLMNMDLEGIAASSGSACTAGTVEDSHVLTAMYGSESDRVKNSIRFSFGRGNTPEEMKEAASRMAAIIERITN